jgi:hypothetical protein
MLAKKMENRNSAYSSLKFKPISEYFRQQTSAIFTLTFDDFEKILGEPLNKTANKFKGYWYRKGERKISNSWLSNGYKIRKIDLQKKRIVFVRFENNLPVKIPDVFLRGRVPENTKAELENFFDYLIKKYGL